MNVSTYVRPLLIIFCVIGVLSLLVVNATGAEKVYKVGITQIATHPALDSIRKGCIQGMADMGLIEGKNVVIDYLTPQGDMSAAKTIADKFIINKKDLIVTITTPSTQSVCAASEATGIPVVFIAVTDPVLAGIVPNWENPCSAGFKITVISDFMPIEPQLDMIKKIVPNAKTLGIVAKFGDEGNTKSVQEMERLAPKYGLKLIRANVSTTADVYSAGLFLAGRADVAWVPMCNTTVSGLEALVAVCEQEKIPLFVPDHDSVNRGGIGAAYYDNFILGREAGKKAARILKGEDPCKIAVSTFPADALKGYALNPQAAKRMGVSIPASLIEEAIITGK